MAEAGAPKEVRLTAPMIIGRMKKMQESLGAPGMLKRMRALHGNLEPAERQTLAGEIDKVRDLLAAISREVRGR